MGTDDSTEESLRADLAAMRNQRNELRGTVTRLEAELAEARSEAEAAHALAAKTEEDWRRVYIRQVETSEAVVPE